MTQIRLTPEAGGIKTNKFRDVPVHEHLLAEGFVEFLKNAPSGHLFCNIPDGVTGAGRIEGCSSS